MIATSPSRAVWRRSVIVLAAGLLAVAVAGVAPAIGGARDPDLQGSATATDAAEPWPESPTFPVPSPAIRGADGLTPGGPGARVAIEADAALPLPEGTRVATALATKVLPLGSLPLGSLPFQALTSRTLAGTQALGALPAGVLTTGTAAAAALAAGTPLDVVPDDARLPATCSASAWQVRLDPAGTGVPRSVVVSLAPGAPDTCQGFTGVLPLVVSARPTGTTAAAADPPDPGTPIPGAAGSPTSAAGDAPVRITARTAEPVTVAVLATPGISVRAEHDRVNVLPIAPTSGPVPGGYAVEIRDRHAGWTPVCTTPDPVDCAVSPADDASGRTYRVTAELGEWRRSSPPVAFPPPAG